MMVYPWQKTIWSGFIQRLQNDSLPHGILFAGPDGIGKRDFSLSFVRYYFCQDKKNNEACGECNACHLLAVKNHPDLFQIAPAEGKQVIAIDQIRELIDYVSLTPHSAPRKVAIIDQVEKLNLHASNSLLKTLEEPPESALLILITHRPDRLLPTILSRCQKLNFTLPDETMAKNWLSDNLEDKHHLDGLLAIANGAPLKALEYEKKDNLTIRNQMLEQFEQLTLGKTSAVSVAAKWLKLDFEFIMQCINTWLVDLVRLKANNMPPMLSNPDIKAQLQKASDKVSLSQLLTFQQSLNEVITLKQHNVNAQLILEDLLIRWAQVCRDAG